MSLRPAVKVLMFIAIGCGVIWLVPTRFDRSKIEEQLGSSVADILYGQCDAAFKAFVERDRTSFPADVAVSVRFLPASLPAIYPVLREEEDQVVALIERNFGWKPSREKFRVAASPQNYATFHVIGTEDPGLRDGFTLDECGYLIGDDYSTRKRHVAVLSGAHEDVPK